ncbi:hypothetical protein, partial [Acinetobacter radioresistens]
LQEYTTTCGKCCSVLEFHKHEATVKVDRNETVYVVNCPVCRNDIWIASQALRSVVKYTDFRDQPYNPK